MSKLSTGVIHKKVGSPQFGVRLPAGRQGMGIVKFGESSKFRTGPDKKEKRNVFLFGRYGSKEDCND